MCIYIYICECASLRKRERERQKGEEEVLGQAFSSVRQARTAARLVHNVSLPNAFWPGRKTETSMFIMPLLWEVEKRGSCNNCMYKHFVYVATLDAHIDAMHLTVLCH